MVGRPSGRAMNSARLTAWDNWMAARPHEEQVLTRAAFRVLTAGRAPSLAELAKTLSQSPEEIKQILRTMDAQGLATLEGDHVTGIGGLSLVLASHALQWNSRLYWTWCALDAIGIPAALGGMATVTSRIVPDGTAVTLTFKNGEWIDRDPTLGIRLAMPQVARLLCGGT